MFNLITLFNNLQGTAIFNISLNNLNMLFIKCLNIYLIYFTMPEKSLNFSGLRNSITKKYIFTYFFSKPIYYVQRKGP